MPDINPSIPVVGQPDSTEEPKVVTALTQLVAAVNDVDSAQITDGGVTYADLNSTVDADYETLCEGSGLFNSAVIGSGGADVFALPTSNSPLRPADGAGFAGRYLDLGRYPAGSRSRKLSLAAAVFVNATPPGITFTVGLYPITAAGGGANVCTITLGAVVAGSGVAFASPSANSLNHGETSDFDFPAAGFYALAVLTSGAIPANTAVAIRARLEYRKV